MMPLSFGNITQLYAIKKIGGDANTRKHLQDLGFTQGTIIQIISKNGGDLIVKVKETRVALGASMAAKILIEEDRMTLKEVAIGEKAVIKKLHGEGAVRRRIMDMGITKGTVVTIRKVAPLGDPIELTVRGYELSIRKEDAEMIEVES